MEKARQQIADAAVVVDHQQMRRIVGQRERGLRHRVSFSASARDRPGR
jgi:hypothetical protein